MPDTEHVTDVKFQPEPGLVLDRLGRELYRPAAALAELVANSLDSGAHHIALTVLRTDLQGAESATLVDDGEGISPGVMLGRFAQIGRPKPRSTASREPIGSKGIGRFAVFALAYSSDWRSTAETETGRVTLTWAMSADDPLHTRVREVPSPGVPTGTTVLLRLKHESLVQALFLSDRFLRRELFNAFAPYLARYRDEVSITVNGSPVALEEYVEDWITETIPESGDVPSATVYHMIVPHNVALDPPNQVLFSTHGSTIARKRLDEVALPNRKYLGIVDSPYLYELTNTAKSELPDFDPKFRALEEAARMRAVRFIQAKSGDRAQAFLQRARTEDFYPFRQHPPQTPIDRARQTVYDNLLLAVEQTSRVSEVSSRQRALIFSLVYKLMDNEDDLAFILSKLMDLPEGEVAQLADILRRTSITSVIAVSSMLTDRLEFITNLEEIVYGRPAAFVRERTQLQKVVEAHTWLFGEEYHLLTSDKSVRTLISKFVDSHPESSTDAEELVENVTDPGLSLVPDLFLSSFRRLDGTNRTQHLIVEIKAPKVRITPSHLEKQYQYAEAIVNNPVFGQEYDSHHFKFVLISAEVSSKVRQRYQKDSAVGFLSRPTYDHPTELWAFRWSDLLDQRQAELNFLYQNLDLTRDPEALEYLRARVGAIEEMVVPGAEVESEAATSAPSPPST